MSKRLILMRHAKSDWTHGLEDHERPLNERGWQAAKLMGNWLKLNEYIPDEVLCSTATRTRETLERLKLDIEASYSGTLYLAEPAQLLHAVKSAKGQTLLVIAHNTGIAYFAEQMAATPPDHPRFTTYPTCATTALDFDVEGWADAAPGSGRVADFIVPRDLE